MPLLTFSGISSYSHDIGNKIDTNMFAQKPYLRTSYIESNTEEDIDLKNHFRIKKLPDPRSIREAVSKSYVDIEFNDPSIIKNTSQIDLNVKSITNVGFTEVNQWPEIGGC